MYEDLTAPGEVLDGKRKLMIGKSVNASSDHKALLPTPTLGNDGEAYVLAVVYNVNYESAFSVRKCLLVLAKDF